MNNLLQTPTFTVRGERTGTLTLPGVLAALGQGRALEFAGLQPHQQHAWHAFLVHLAAYGLDHAERFDPNETEEGWRELLLELTADKEEPWCLHVADLKKPAFMQPPDADASTTKWTRYPTPDDIDLLVSAKNHDIKISRMREATPEHWVYALVSLQTMQGVSGRGHYGISRMNAGFGNRPCMTLLRRQHNADRFLRDVALLLSDRRRLLEQYKYLPTGKGLLWLEPWDGKSSFDPKKLHPFFIEVCHRARLVPHPRYGLEGRMAPSTQARIASNGAKGNMGDLWAPRRPDDGAVLTVNARGFSYEIVTECLFEYNLPPSFSAVDDGAEPRWLWMQALARGRGKTEGFHERLLELPSKFASLLRQEKPRQALRSRALERIEMVRTFALRILKPALLCYMQAGPERIKFDDARADVWMRAFHRAVDAIFFEHFFQVLHESDESGHDSWALALLDKAEPLFKRALTAAPTDTFRRYRSCAIAERVFYGAIHNQMPTHFREALWLDEQEKEPTHPVYPVVYRLAGLLAHHRSSHDAALLQRMPLEGERIQAFRDVCPEFANWNDELERRWVLIVRAMALLTHGRASMHRPLYPLGKALQAAGAPESRVLTLLNARGSLLARWVLVVVRQLVMRATAFDHGELAELILSDGEFTHNDTLEPWHHTIRRKIAKDYFHAKNQE